jgi:hypothetical protein
MKPKDSSPPCAAASDDYLTEEEQAAELSVSTRTLARWRAMRAGPANTTIGRKIRYRRRWTAGWLERRARDPEAETRGQRRRAAATSPAA